MSTSDGRRKFLGQVTAAALFSLSANTPIGAAKFFNHSYSHIGASESAELKNAKEGTLKIGPWKDLPPQPIGLAAHFSWWDDQRLMAAGGSYWEAGQKHFVASIWSYLDGDEIWLNSGKLPIPVAYMVGMTFQKNPYIFGGSRDNKATKDCYRLLVDHKTGTATSEPLPSLPIPLDCAGGALVGSKAMIVGGAGAHDDIETYSSDLLWYDLKDHGSKWNKGSVFPGSARCIPATASLGDSLFVFGGFKFQKPNTLRNLSDAYVYNARSDSWTRIANLPFAIRSASACSVGDRYILLVGGAGNPPEQPARFNTVLMYDSVKDSYVNLLPLPHSVSVPYATVKGDYLYVVGGEPPNGNRVSRVLSSRIESARP